MIKKVTLNYSWGSLEDREPFLCGAEDRLELTFATAYSVTDAVVTCENRTVGAKHSERVRSLDSYVVPAELLKAGELCVKVQLLVRGEPVKEFTVEPILLKEIDANIQAMPEIEALKQEITKLHEHDGKITQGFNAMVDKLAEVNQRLKILEAKNEFDETIGG